MPRIPRPWAWATLLVIALGAALAGAVIMRPEREQLPEAASTPVSTAPSPRGERQTDPAGACAHAADPGCIVVVYRGAPDDYPGVAGIPDPLVIEPDARGRYQVERGWRVTVVTAAHPPAGYTDLLLGLSPDAHPPPAVYPQVELAAGGASYAFTVMPDEDGPALFAVDLTAANPPAAPGREPDLGDVLVSAEFLVPTLRYHTLDVTGAAGAHGSYAFLTRAGEPSSAYPDLRRPLGAAELRLNLIDASGASRAALFDAVEVGDTVDYLLRGVICAARFEVTSVDRMGGVQVFGVREVTAIGGWCDTSSYHPGDPRLVEFAWGQGPGLEGTDGITVLQQDEPVGPGTYRLQEDLPYVIDVPVGAEISFAGPVLAGGYSLLRLRLHGTNSVLFIDSETGAETSRHADPPDASDVLDEISSSLRELPVPVPRWPAAYCRGPADITCMLVVYAGSPEDYQQPSEVPLSAVLIPDVAGRYHVERGQQVTVVLADGLTGGVAGLHLQRRGGGDPALVAAGSVTGLDAPAYTFTVDGAGTGPNLLVYDLMADGGAGGTAPVLGDVIASATFLVPTLRYDRLDRGGAAAQAGRYAFLREAGDPSSAVGGMGRALGESVQLVIHPEDAGRTSRASFYDAVRVGETVDVRWRGAGCGSRFRITEVGPAASPRTFGIELIDSYGDRCGEPLDAGGPSAVDFVWGLRPGADPSGARPPLFRGQPNGPGTYRLQEGSRCEVDVPVGVPLVHDGLFLGITLGGSEEPLRLVTVLDPTTGSRLHVEPESCLVRGAGWTSEERQEQMAGIVRAGRASAPPAGPDEIPRARAVGAPPAQPDEASRPASEEAPRSACGSGGAVDAPAENPGLLADCELLLAARETLRPGRPLNWSARTAIGDWSGVAVTGSPSRVSGLDLSETGLAGTIPAALGRLAALRTLDLAGNELTGRVPPELGDLSELVSLDLSDNRLSGEFPTELGDRHALERVHLRGNDLSGCLHDGPRDPIGGGRETSGLPLCPVTASSPLQLQVRLWQGASDGGDVHVSARVRGDLWATHGTRRLALDAESRGERYATFAIEVPGREEPPTSIDVRIWRNTRPAGGFDIQARAEGAPWLMLGRVPLGLDDGVGGDGRYRYGDITATIPLSTLPWYRLDGPAPCPRVHAPGWGAAYWGDDRLRVSAVCSWVDDRGEVRRSRIWELYPGYNLWDDVELDPYAKNITFTFYDGSYVVPDVVYMIDGVCTYQSELPFATGIPGIPRTFATMAACVAAGERGEGG